MVFDPSEHLKLWCKKIVLLQWHLKFAISYNFIFHRLGTLWGTISITETRVCRFLKNVWQGIRRDTPCSFRRLTFMAFAPFVSLRNVCQRQSIVLNCFDWLSIGIILGALTTWSSWFESISWHSPDCKVAVVRRRPRRRGCTVLTLPTDIPAGMPSSITGNQFVPR